MTQITTIKNKMIKITKIWNNLKFNENNEKYFQSNDNFNNKYKNNNKVDLSNCEEIDENSI